MTTQVFEQQTDELTNFADDNRALILPLNHADVSLAQVGGKGANLTKLAHAGFPVPGGFLVTTAGYTTFVAANDLLQTIADALADLDATDPAALEKASATIRTAFHRGIMPAVLTTALRQHYQRIGRPPVAVRSSATAEDLPDMSFAGQQDTYLNVVGDAALLDAVKDCWGSLWTARAIGYRSRNQIAHSDVALSVVVQEMVQSEASGVLFTANPLTGNRGETVIDATLGLGEALVSGLVEPDHYIVETVTGQIRSKTLGKKATVIQSQSGGGTVTTSGEQAGHQALPDAQILALTALGRRVADFYDFPQDIEWAWANGQLYLLQARPITSLYPVPTLRNPQRSQVQPEVYFSFGAIQGMLDPMTPLGQDAIKIIFAGGARLFGFAYDWQTQPLITAAGERLWVRVSELFYNRIGQRVLPKFLGVVEPSIEQAVRHLLTEPAFAGSGLPRPKTVARIIRFIGSLLPTVVRAAIDPDGQRQVAQQKTAAMLQMRAAQMAAATTFTERVDLFVEIVASGFPFAVPTLVPRIAPGMFAMNRLIALADQHLGQSSAGQRRALEVARGLPHNVTTEMDLLLWHSAQTIRRDEESAAVLRKQAPTDLAEQALQGALPTVAQQTIDTFLQTYGMRGLAEIDFGRPRWRETPTQVMQMLQSYLRIDEPSQAPDAVFARGEAAADAVIADLAAAVHNGPLGVVRSKMVYAWAKRMRALAGLRETPKFIIIRLFGIARAGLLQSGQQLVDVGTLERADDLMFLHLPELRALAAGEARDWTTLIAERRATYAREKRRNQIPRVIVSDGRAFYEGVQPTREEHDGVITGSPVSPGLVEGTVHVVFDPHDAQLAPGEILVCPGTDPAWTPLFLAAGGLVMEVGG
ncbi:MAG: hypothetical protein KDE53_15650, partial [Caldilineaceae bacterium]|nr:hypothetical protein [Caldilineaceae bacterium]